MAELCAQSLASLASARAPYGLRATLGGYVLRSSDKAVDVLREDDAIIVEALKPVSPRVVAAPAQRSVPPLRAAPAPAPAPAAAPAPARLAGKPTAPSKPAPPQAASSSESSSESSSSDSSSDSSSSDSSEDDDDDKVETKPDNDSSDSDAPPNQQSSAAPPPAAVQAPAPAPAPAPTPSKMTPVQLALARLQARAATVTVSKVDGEGGGDDVETRPRPAVRDLDLPVTLPGDPLFGPTRKRQRSADPPPAVAPDSTLPPLKGQPVPGDCIQFQRLTLSTSLWQPVLLDAETRTVGAVNPPNVTLVPEGDFCQEDLRLSDLQNTVLVSGPTYDKVMGVELPPPPPQVADVLAELASKRQELMGALGTMETPTPGKRRRRARGSRGKGGKGKTPTTT